MTHAILTCSEQFTDLALNELQRHHPRLSVIHPIPPNYLYLQAPGTFDALTRPWRHKLPIYLHHLFPVHETIALKGSRRDLHTITTAATALLQPRIGIQVRFAENVHLPYGSRQLYRHLIQQRNRQTAESARGSRVLSVLVACGEKGLTAYLGKSWASQNLSPYAGGVHPVHESLPNRAGLKLLEALSTFNVRLRPNDHALDLGAAPGAWTMVLRRHHLRVTAVAPDAMYPWLLDDSCVRVVTSTAEAYLPTCDTTFDLITNDMRLDGQPSARLMVDYADYLRPEGIAIMTVKLRSNKRRSIMDHTFRILRKAYKIITVRQLVSNRMEVTLFLRRKT